MKKRIELFFSREDLNTGRQLNVDYAKTLAIFFMILVHTFMYPCYSNLTTGFAEIIYAHLGSYLSAPVFVISMGLGLAFTRFSDSKSIIKRGVKILIMAFVLNVVRCLIPILLSIVKNDITVFEDEIMRSLLFGDILHFAGLALITFGLLKKTKLSALNVFIICLIINTVMTFVPNINTDSIIVGSLLGMIIPVFYCNEIYSWFPLLTWYVFVAFGYLFGLIIRKVKNLDKFYLWSIIIGFILYAIFFVTDEVIFDLTEYKTGYDSTEYYNTIYIVLYTIGSTMTLYGVFHFLTKFTPKFLDDFCYKTSAAVNEIYIISWLIIFNVFFVIFGMIYPSEYSLWFYLIASFIITAISIILGWKYREYKLKRNTNILK